MRRRARAGARRASARSRPTRVAGRHDVAVAEVALRTRVRSSTRCVGSGCASSGRAGSARSYGIDTISSSWSSAAATISTTWRTDSTSSSPTLNTLPGGGVGLVDREQQRVREVLGVAVVVEREAVVGDDDPVAGRRGCAARRTTRAARAGTARTRTGSGSARRRGGASNTTSSVRAMR